MNKKLYLIELKKLILSAILKYKSRLDSRGAKLTYNYKTYIL
jgi:hypothetical protein